MNAATSPLGPLAGVRGRLRAAGTAGRRGGVRYPVDETDDEIIARRAAADG